MRTSCCLRGCMCLSSPSACQHLCRMRTPLRKSRCPFVSSQNPSRRLSQELCRGPATALVHPRHMGQPFTWAGYFPGFSRQHCGAASSNLMGHPTLLVQRKRPTLDCVRWLRHLKVWFRLVRSRDRCDSSPANTGAVPGSSIQVRVEARVYELPAIAARLTRSGDPELCQLRLNLLIPLL